MNRAPALRRFVGARRLLSVPLAAAATIAVAALVAVLALPGGGREDELGPGSVHEELSYRVPDNDADHAAEVLRRALPPRAFRRRPYRSRPATA